MLRSIFQPTGRSQHTSITAVSYAQKYEADTTYQCERFAAAGRALLDPWWAKFSDVGQETLKEMVLGNVRGTSKVGISGKLVITPPVVAADSFVRTEPGKQFVYREKKKEFNVQGKKESIHFDLGLKLKSQSGFRQLSTRQDSHSTGNRGARYEEDDWMMADQWFVWERNEEKKSSTKSFDSPSEE